MLIGGYGSEEEVSLEEKQVNQKKDQQTGGERVATSGDRK